MMDEYNAKSTPHTRHRAFEIARASLLSAGGIDEIGFFSGLRTALRHGGDFADLYARSHLQENWSLERGLVTRGNFAQNLGFGLRVVSGEQTLLATASTLDAGSIERAAMVVKGARGQGATPVGPIHLATDGPAHYSLIDPLAVLGARDKIALLESIDIYARAQDPRVVDVQAQVSTVVDLILIARSDGTLSGDTRPLTRLDLTVHVLVHGRRATATRAVGGRNDPASSDAATLKRLIKEAVDAALMQIEASETPAGTADVVIGPGWNGVLLHEAIGHGLEGDFNRRGSSAFAGLIGQRVAARGVTIVDDATVPGGRGSFNVDDEGAPGQCTTLVEDGILVGYLQDALNARLAKTVSTGNGRRQSHDALPLPRMTNTYLRGGAYDPEEIIESVESGIYVASLGGGRVDIASGRFMFSASEAFLIENGRITAPLRGATVVGQGADALTRIRLVGRDLEIDKARGVCVKEGQSLPVGVGQPTLRIDGLSVSGTQ